MEKNTYWDRSATNDTLFDMVSRITSETCAKKKWTGENIYKKTRGTRKRDLRTEEDKRVDEDKWLYKDMYEEPIAEWKIRGHGGNPSGIVTSNYWPKQVGSKPWEGEESEEVSQQCERTKGTEDLDQEVLKR